MTEEQFIALKEGDKVICRKNLTHEGIWALRLKRGKVYTVKERVNLTSIIFVKESDLGAHYRKFKVIPCNSIRFIKSL